jgi:hypothetical protein
LQISDLIEFLKKKRPVSSLGKNGWRDVIRRAALGDARALGTVRVQGRAPLVLIGAVVAAEAEAVEESPERDEVLVDHDDEVARRGAADESVLYDP